MEKKTEMRKHFLHCNIAGFTYCDGCIVFGELTIGSELKLVREAENRHDPEAVAVYYNDVKLGFIPNSENETISKFLDMGYDDIFEVRVSRLCKEAHPESQVFVNVYLKRNQK